MISLITLTHCAVLAAGTLGAGDAPTPETRSSQDLEARLQALEDRNDELERRLALLSEEVE